MRSQARPEAVERWIASPRSETIEHERDALRAVKPYVSPSAAADASRQIDEMLADAESLV